MVLVVLITAGSLLVYQHITKIKTNRFGYGLLYTEEDPVLIKRIIHNIFSKLHH